MLIFNILHWTFLLSQPCFAHFHVDKYHKVQQRKEHRRSYSQQRSQLLDNSSCTSPSCYRYYNPNTAPYLIKSWPDVDFDTGEFYGGSIPIDASDPSRTLFFIFKPAETIPVDEITIWMNGGPGCSSLEGFFQENGPISWYPGTRQAVQNPWAWSKLTNVLWVEQPVGTGFAQGKVTATNEISIARDFMAFFENWQALFGIENYKTYLTGESYAGRYIPYIGAQMLDRNDTTTFNLAGALIYDPCIGDCFAVQEYYPTYYFTLANNQILNFPEPILEEMRRISEDCGYTSYMDTYLQFPPAGIQPPSHLNLVGKNFSCDIDFRWDQVISASNPCYYCPLLWDVLHDDSVPYFNRPSVKTAIHAPQHINWTECTSQSVFLHYNTDKSPDAILGPLPQIIEATNRVLVSNGQWDALVYTNGTLLAIQNMTWNGMLGFQDAPRKDFVVNLVDRKDERYDIPQGVMGRQHYERGLLWVETFQAGHQQPQYQPRAAYRHLQWILGRIDEL